MSSEDCRNSNILQNICREQYIVEIRINNGKSDFPLKNIRGLEILNRRIGRSIVFSKDTYIDGSTHNQEKPEVPRPIVTYLHNFIDARNSRCQNNKERKRHNCH